MASTSPLVPAVVSGMELGLAAATRPSRVSAAATPATTSATDRILDRPPRRRSRPARQEPARTYSDIAASLPGSPMSARHRRARPGTAEPAPRRLVEDVLARAPYGARKRCASSMRRAADPPPVVTRPAGRVCGSGPFALGGGGERAPRGAGDAGEQGGQLHGDDELG